MKRKINTSLVVSVSFEDEKHGVLIVGRKHAGKIEIVNALENEDAWNMWKKLTIIEKPKKNSEHNKK